MHLKENVGIMRNSYSAFLALALLFQSPLAQCDDTDTRLIPSLDPSTFRTSLNEIHIEHDNQSRRLLVVTPHDFEKDSIYPVLLCFHGAGGRAEGQARRWGQPGGGGGLRSEHSKGREVGGQRMRCSHDGGRPGAGVGGG